MSRLWLSVVIVALGLVSSSLPGSATNDCVPKDIFFTDRIDLRNPGQHLGAKADGIEKLYLYVAMDCAHADEHEQFGVRWFFNGKVLQTQAIPLGVSPNWRTFSYATARSGRWRVELSWASGSVFAAQEIQIE